MYVFSNLISIKNVLPESINQRYTNWSWWYYRICPNKYSREIFGGLGSHSRGWTGLLVSWFSTCGLLGHFRVRGTNTWENGLWPTGLFTVLLKLCQESVFATEARRWAGSSLSPHLAELQMLFIFISVQPFDKSYRVPWLNKNHVSSSSLG